jgi:hypothetical protein
MNIYHWNLCVVIGRVTLGGGGQTDSGRKHRCHVDLHPAGLGSKAANPTKLSQLIIRYYMH